MAGKRCKFWMKEEQTMAILLGAQLV